MKSLALILSHLSAPLRRRNARLVVVLLGLFVVLVALFSTLFHVLMEREGQSHSWPTSFYWTLVTMTTLGFGDITFKSDLGRLFSVVVLLSGTAFLLVLLPFTFIQFVFVPWMARRDASRAPRELPKSAAGHLVLTRIGAIEDALIRRAEQTGVDYVVLVPDLTEALKLHDSGYRVMLGAIDDPAAYRAARVEQAALVATTHVDTTNANVIFTVREISPTVPLVATATKEASIDILRLAGADEVLRLGDMLGTAMAARALAPDGKSHVIGQFAGVLVAEARVAGTSLAGRTLAEPGLRERVGVGIIGVWEHGVFTLATPDQRLGQEAVLLLAGTRAELDAYDDHYATGEERTDSVLIIGGGRVGRAAGRAFAVNGTHYRIVEQRPDLVRDEEHYVVGDAASLDVLEQAGVRSASTVLITTHDDDMNIYLSIYCQRLRPEMRIVARANLDRNVSTLYRAGADDVLSYGSTGAAAIWNHFRANDTLVIAEGLDVFRSPVPMALYGKTLAESDIRSTTGCSVVAIDSAGTLQGNPSGQARLQRGQQLILIGDDAARERYALWHAGLDGRSVLRRRSA